MAGQRKRSAKLERQVVEYWRSSLSRAGPISHRTAKRVWPSSYCDNAKKGNVARELQSLARGILVINLDLIHEVSVHRPGRHCRLNLPPEMFDLKRRRLLVVQVIGHPVPVSTTSGNS
jgi:hypothetical protein